MDIRVVQIKKKKSRKRLAIIFQVRIKKIKILVTTTEFSLPLGKLRQVVGIRILNLTFKVLLLLHVKFFFLKGNITSEH